MVGGPSVMSTRMVQALPGLIQEWAELDEGVGPVRPRGRPGFCFVVGGILSWAAGWGKSAESM